MSACQLFRLYWYDVLIFVVAYIVIIYSLKEHKSTYYIIILYFTAAVTKGQSVFKNVKIDLQTIPPSKGKPKRWRWGTHTFHTYVGIFSTDCFKVTSVWTDIFTQAVNRYLQTEITFAWGHNHSKRWLTWYKKEYVCIIKWLHLASINSFTKYSFWWGIF